MSKKSADNNFVLLKHVVEDAMCGGATIWIAQKKSEVLIDPTVT